MLNAISDTLPQTGVKIAKANHDFSGGYFIWLKLPPGISALHLTAKASKDENLLIGSGGMFRVEGDMSYSDGRLELDQYVRLCFAYEEEGNLKQGVERLAKLVKEMISERSKGQA